PDQRSYDPARRTVKSGQKLRKGIAGEPYVGVNDTEVRRTAIAKRGVVVRTKALGNRVSHNLHARPQRSWVGDVLRHDDFHALGTESLHIFEKCVDQCILAMTD